jgi:Dyp-type peroxidase family
MSQHIVRETMAPSMVEFKQPDPSKPDVGPNKGPREEPVLDIDNIQGNLINGFNKDHRMLLFLRIDDPEDFKVWLKSQIPFIATAAEVLAFNRLFKQTRKRRGREGAVKSTWVNIAFTFQALKKLTGEANLFKDPAFREDIRKRAKLLGDPVDKHGEPINWVVGGPHNPEVHVLIIVEADDCNDLTGEVNRIEESITNFAPKGRQIPSGVSIVHYDEGNNLPPPLSGHEHFGFLDGVSQPGLRGRISPKATDVLTLRQNPDKRDQLNEEGKIVAAQGKPGQDLLWPGEFIFGYQGQDPEESDEYEGLNGNPGPNSLTGLKQGEPPDPKKMVAPEWARNGSYLVFRRLSQDVGTFHQFVRDIARALGIPDPVNSSAAKLVGAKLVGRWPSGAPVEREPAKENPDLADNDCQNNYFEFADDTDPISPVDPRKDPFACTDPTDDRFPHAKADRSGSACPFTGHIRKAYPRDDKAALRAKVKSVPADPCDARRDLNESQTQTHRLLRRGIPFGPVSRSTPETPYKDTVDRGLQFLAYMTSIQDQFEFVNNCWVNNADFKEPQGPAASDPPSPLKSLDRQGGGFDPIIGQNSLDPHRIREFTVTVPDPLAPFELEKAKAYRVSTKDPSTGKGLEWVRPTGGGYFFAPSITALTDVLTKQK